MTSRERLLAPFRGVKPDRPAWLVDLTYWYGAAQAMGQLEPQYQGEEGYRRLHEDLGVLLPSKWTYVHDSVRGRGLPLGRGERGARAMVADAGR